MDDNEYNGVDYYYHRCIDPAGEPMATTDFQSLLHLSTLTEDDQGLSVEQKFKQELNQ